MKLLLDQNLSRKLVLPLGLSTPARHTCSCSACTKRPTRIWYYARHHQYTVVTKNTDMVDLCVLRGNPPKVLWLRLGNCSTGAALEVMRQNEDRILEFEADESRTVLSLFRFKPL